MGRADARHLEVADGGVDWSYTNIGTVNGQSLSNDVYSYPPIPTRRITAVSFTPVGTPAHRLPLLESFDAGKSWVVHQPPLAVTRFRRTSLPGRQQDLAADGGGGVLSDSGRRTHLEEGVDAMLQHGGNQVYRARKGRSMWALLARSCAARIMA